MSKLVDCSRAGSDGGDDEVTYFGFTMQCQGAMFFMHADLGDGDSDWTEYVLRVCKTRNTATTTGTAQGRLQCLGI